MRRSSVRQERCAHTTKNRTEVLCPRVTRRSDHRGLHRSGCGVSGTFATATSGAAYWAASVRHGPPWPLPVNAPKSIFQNSILYYTGPRTQWAPLLLVGSGWEHGFIQPQSGGKDAFDSAPACLSSPPPLVFALVK